MVAMLLVGPLGSLLHLGGSVGPAGELVEERLLRGAPLMAPLLFSNVGFLGLIALMDPEE
ncbi:MAG: hypothetical protein P8R42_02205 [Candidatus Binatia bacterium]|nr:hypothetical protein [Candidatus Binatia bacterium]